ncbi:MAG: hypothetical protein J3R72DRAFT_498742 [Linnemannia gamsii]|nr:MAG: hypothetical protein J3R72DRAFT_498742 [Linnemannia gamsii]
MPDYFMAGFLANEPFTIEQDSIAPPLDVQRHIFPWIEQQFDGSASWLATCDREMNGTDPGKVTESNIFDETAPPDVDATTAPMASSHNDRVKFLLLLLRMCRVILQDAVLYLVPDSKGQTLINSLLRLDIFSSDAFLAFKRALLTKFESTWAVTTIIPTEVPIDGPTITAGISAVGDKLKEIFEIHDSRLSSIEEQVTMGLKSTHELINKLNQATVARDTRDAQVHARRVQLRRAWLEEGLRMDEDELLGGGLMDSSTFNPSYSDLHHQHLPKPSHKKIPRPHFHSRSRSSSWMQSIPYRNKMRRRISVRHRILSSNNITRLVSKYTSDVEEKPFLPDPQGGKLPLYIAWLEYKYLLRPLKNLPKVSRAYPLEPNDCKLLIGDNKDKAALRRRSRLFDTLLERAEREGTMIEKVIEDLMEAQRGETFNANTALVLGEEPKVSNEKADDEQEQEEK